MEDNKTLNDIQQMLDDEKPEAVQDPEEEGKSVPLSLQEMPDGALSKILIYLSVKAPIAKQHRDELREAASRLQKREGHTLSEETAIKVLQTTGWMQAHDRAILSPYACISRLQESGWMERHDAEITGKTIEETRDACLKNEANLRKEYEAELSELEDVRKELEAARGQISRLRTEAHDAVVRHERELGKRESSWMAELAQARGEIAKLKAMAKAPDKAEPADPDQVPPPILQIANLLMIRGCYDDILAVLMNTARENHRRLEVTIR